MAAALAIVAAVMAFGWWRSTRPVERALVRLDVDLGPDVSLGSTREPTKSFRPTARGWCTCRKGGSLPGGSISPTPLSLQERKGHMSLFSPGRAVGRFLHAGKAAKDFGGGWLGNHLVQRGQWCGGSWGEDGNIIAALSYQWACRGFLPPEVRQRQ